MTELDVGGEEDTGDKGLKEQRDGFRGREQRSRLGVVEGAEIKSLI